MFVPHVCSAQIGALRARLRIGRLVAPPVLQPPHLRVVRWWKVCRTGRHCRAGRRELLGTDVRNALRYDRHGSSYIPNTMAKNSGWDSLIYNPAKSIKSTQIKSVSKMLVFMEFGAVGRVRDEGINNKNFHYRLKPRGNHNSVFADGHVDSIPYQLGVFFNADYTLDRNE